MDLKKRWRAFRTGYVDGYTQPFEMTWGREYRQPHLQNAYDLGAYVGQVFGERNFRRKVKQWRIKS